LTNPIPAKKVYSVRAQAAKTLAAVLQQQASLAGLMAPALEQVPEQDQSLLQELCFGVCRWQPKLQAILNRLLEKPLKDKDSDIHALLLLGLYQLDYTRIPDHAALSATVDACKELKKNWANKLINALLRRYLAEKATLETLLETSPSFQSAHPNWLRKQIETHWPAQATAIFTANNTHPPFTIRVNTHLQSRESLITQLPKAHATPFSPFGITLEKATDVVNIPGFSDGKSSVQDEAAQLAPFLLQAETGHRVLDACAAPGGKTGHIREVTPDLKEMVAIDLEERRLERVRENLLRLKQTATLISGDANDTNSWWNGEMFDRILLDAPCSATGVIRRHPDIKILRKATDIKQLSRIQLQLLLSLWPLLKPGGRLVYATCSILPQENTEVIAQFLATQTDIQHEIIDADWGILQTYGRQLLPQIAGHDGFYYACLSKLL
jgi:16S rRNA (cytosine967-C5)-methyltransferase